MYFLKGINKISRQSVMIKLVKWIYYSINIDITFLNSATSFMSILTTKVRCIRCSKKVNVL